MSREHRIQSPNILFHVITRGNGRQAVFHDVADRQEYLFLLARYKLKFDMRLYQYVLMGNHVHLLLEPTREATISKFMSAISAAYAYYYNAKYGTAGHVWQGRFRSIAIQTEAYYIRCAVYIELNPVRARIVEHPSEYLWSSYAVSVQKRACAWIDRHPLLEAASVAHENGLSVYESLIQSEIQKAIEQRDENFSRYSAYGQKEFLDWYEAETRVRTKTESTGDGNGAGTGVVQGGNVAGTDSVDVVKVDEVHPRLP